MSSTARNTIIITHSGAPQTTRRAACRVTNSGRHIMLVAATLASLCVSTSANAASRFSIRETTELRVAARAQIDFTIIVPAVILVGETVIGTKLECCDEMVIPSGNESILDTNSSAERNSPLACSNGGSPSYAQMQADDVQEPTPDSSRRGRSKVRPVSYMVAMP